MNVPGSVYSAGAQTKERSALRLTLLNLNIQVVGQAADWMASHEQEAESAKIAHSRTLPDLDLSLQKPGVQER